MQKATIDRCFIGRLRLMDFYRTLHLVLVFLLNILNHLTLNRVIVKYKICNCKCWNLQQKLGVPPAIDVSKGTEIDSKEEIFILQEKIDGLKSEGQRIDKGI